MSNFEKIPHIGTDCVHAGFDHDPQTGAVIPPINLSTTFKQVSPGHPIGVFTEINAFVTIHLNSHMNTVVVQTRLVMF